MSKLCWSKEVTVKCRRLAIVHGLAVWNKLGSPSWLSSSWNMVVLWEDVELTWFLGIKMNHIKIVCFHTGESVQALFSYIHVFFILNKFWMSFSFCSTGDFWHEMYELINLLDTHIRIWDYESACTGFSKTCSTLTHNILVCVNPQRLSQLSSGKHNCIPKSMGGYIQYLFFILQKQDSCDRI